MEKLKVFLNSLTTAKQREFAQRVGTSINYLRKAICRKQQLGAAFCIAIERESGGAVCCEDLVSVMSGAPYGLGGVSPSTARCAATGGVSILR
ncbi:helix-turn-helix domain-containing protein [Burkholderia multivorans]|uniref:helix-turn-helix domain-containing protein n=1 Tax=Burkholderia multivorans TaxID=87883 RepID=UPI0020183F61|nr:helix-turn-helix domain-containing protein [Burkholderia multivorans]MCO1361021.1 helix-turn-helix domain-containing protein [Burkholderia multivorans]MCO1420791.1 helix-turn-helix domain-containing protein [Burkholderia multivorans]UQO93356.1 helix-turn-helix domain-containing protein [Burkholderia multivorans]